MSKDRDDLAGLVFKGWTAQDPPPDLHHRYTDTADAILAAGWRPPARQITTVEELQALPEGTIVRSASGTITSLEQGEALLFGMDRRADPTWLKLPLTVLYTPGGA